MSYETITYQRRGAGAWIVLNRPAAMNSLDPTVISEVGDAVRAAEADEGVRAIVFTGAGERAFCAGADLSFALEAVLAGDTAGFRAFVDDIAVVFHAIETSRKPTIAALNGITLAGGLELVLCCDLVFAAERAKIGDAHANYGLIPGGGGSVRLPRKIGPTRAKYLLYTGDFVPARELVEAGLVNAVFPDAELGPGVEAVVERIASKSPLALRRVKALADDALEQPLAPALRAELLALDAHLTSEDLRAGLVAFREKRAPRFEGR